MPHSSKYLTNEAVFSLPGGFRDSTSNVLSWSGDDGRSITLTVQRADSEGLSIHAFAERAVREYSSGLRDFALDSSASGLNAGAERRTFRFASDDGELVMAQAFVPTPSAVLIITAAGLPREAERADAMIRDVIASFELKPA